MSLADKVVAPFDGVQIVPAYADTYPNVKIGGLSQPAAWPSGVYAAPGEPVFVAQLVKPDAPAQNVVLGRVGADGPREATVTTVPGGSDTNHRHRQFRGVHGHIPGRVHAHCR